MTASTTQPYSSREVEFARSSRARANAAPLHAFDLASLRVAIRTLLQTDLATLEWHGGPDLRSFYEWEWRRHEATELTVLVADFNGYAIAQLALHWSGKPSHPHLPDVQSLRVHPAFRGLGIGGRILHVAETLAAGAGYSDISLAVGIHNDAARRLYERVGYRAVGDSYEDIWHYVDRSGATITVSETVVDMVKQLER